IMDGTIRRVTKSSNGYGVLVDIEYPDGTVHRNAHLKDYSKGLKAGSKVKAGDVLGTVGHSGNANSNFPHNHYEVIKKDYYDSYTSKGQNPPGRANSQAELNKGRINPHEYY